jgi:hypothetical protein
MIPLPLQRSLTALRLTLAVMIAWLSIPSAFPNAATLASPHAGLAGFQRVLASVEMVAAALLLAPALVGFAAWALIAVFAVAIGVHVLHGEYRVGALAIYLAATAVVLTARAPRGPRHSTSSERQAPTATT